MISSKDQFSKAGVAEQFAKSKVHSEKEFLEKIVGLAELDKSTSTVLDVATGTGFVAVEFALRTRGPVVGSDITREMLAWARKHSLRESVDDHTCFLVAEAARQPFPDASFDMVVSRLALHHIAAPGLVVNEMARLITPRGRVVVADQISPEDYETARFHDEFERFRDPSHQRALKLSELDRIFKESGLTVKAIEFSPVVLEMEDWAIRTGCNATQIRKLREMMLDAPQRFRQEFGIREENGHVYFRLQRVIQAGTL